MPCPVGRDSKNTHPDYANRCTRERIRCAPKHFEYAANPLHRFTDIG